MSKYSRTNCHTVSTLGMTSFPAFNTSAIETDFLGMVAFSFWWRSLGNVNETVLLILFFVLELESLLLELAIGIAEEVLKTLLFSTGLRIVNAIVYCPNFLLE